MHRFIQDHLEEVLAESSEDFIKEPVRKHLEQCDECRSQLAGMRRQSAMLRTLRAQEHDSQELGPRPGFYARVMERIEAQGAASIWQLFFDSQFGRRIAVASMALALLLGVYLVSSERMAEPPVVVEAPIPMLPGQMLPGEDQPG